MIPPLAREYLDLGYDAVPLRPGQKAAFCADWPRLSPVVQWQNAPSNANIGLRGGGDAQAAYADCDDWPTWETVMRYLAGLGYYADGDYPTVATAHDNRHAYVRLAQRPAGDFKLFRRAFGRGEFRYGPGAQVAAPPSVVDGCEYRLLQGDLRQLPRLDLADLREFIDLDAPTAPANPTPARATISRLARRLLAGETFTRYASRSEADMALCAALANTGHDFASVLTLFATWPTSGKFAELRQQSEREAIRYLRRTFDRAAQWTETESPGRARGRAAQQWALSRPWPGRYGNSDMAVYLAHCELARRTGKDTYGAGVRELAELAGVALATAQKANRRLVDAGLITFERGHAGTLSALYRLREQSYNTPSRPYRVGVYQSCSPADDAFRFRGLGKSAALALAQLARQPMTRAELVAATGKGRDTVRRVLAKLERLIDPATGEVLRLVECEGETWRIVAGVDLDAVARAVGTAGAGDRQRAQHAKERTGFRRAIARAQAATTPLREGETTP